MIVALMFFFFRMRIWLY